MSRTDKEGVFKILISQGFPSLVNFSRLFSRTTNLGKSLLQTVIEDTKAQGKIGLLKAV